jgi:DNA-directed RNA polymerase sigma subunit (sigma70/sigma32)
MTDHTSEEFRQRFHVTRERIHQIEAIMLAKLQAQASKIEAEVLAVVKGQASQPKPPKS